MDQNEQKWKTFVEIKRYFFLQNSGCSLNIEVLIELFATNKTTKKSFSFGFRSLQRHSYCSE